MITEWHGVIQVVIQLITGAVGVPIFNYIKLKLSLEDLQAQLLVALLAALLGVFEVFVTAQVGLGDFTWEAFPQAFGIVFAAAQVWFRYLKEREASE
jgi:protein-S-isoprenylcysteine O-methyltransferase Ste14